MVSAIIVAAGRSRRMGFDKLLSRLGDKPVVILLDRAVSRECWTGGRGDARR